MGHIRTMQIQPRAQIVSILYGGISSLMETGDSPRNLGFSVPIALGSEAFWIHCLGWRKQNDRLAARPSVNQARCRSATLAASLCLHFAGLPKCGCLAASSLARSLLACRSPPCASFAVCATVSVASCRACFATPLICTVSLG